MAPRTPRGARTRPAGGWTSGATCTRSASCCTNSRPACGRARPRNALDRVPRELAAVIHRCLESDPARRYQTAAELAAALAGRGNSSPRAGRCRRRDGSAGGWSRIRFAALVLAAFLPHLVSTIVNIGYNAVDVPLNPRAGARLRGSWLGYNLATTRSASGRRASCPANLAFAARPNVDDTRRRVRQLGWWTIGLGMLGWLPPAAWCSRIRKPRRRREAGRRRDGRTGRCAFASDLDRSAVNVAAPPMPTGFARPRGSMVHDDTAPVGAVDHLIDIGRRRIIRELAEARGNPSDTNTTVLRPGNA